MVQSELAVSLLGGLRIGKDGQAVTGFASRKAEALLVYLACAERPIPRETADLSVSLNAYAPNVPALLGFVCWKYYRGDPEWAVSLWSRACSELFVAHSQWIRLALPDVWPNANPDSERLSKRKSNQPPISTLIKKAVAEIQMSQ